MGAGAGARAGAGPSQQSSEGASEVSEMSVGSCEIWPIAAGHGQLMSPEPAGATQRLERADRD